MNPEQIATRLYNSIHRETIKYNSTLRSAIFQALIDELDREMGIIDEENAGEADEHFPDEKEPMDEDD